jgi:Zn-dependent peptidase ImmA (M78 family)
MNSSNPSKAIKTIKRNMEIKREEILVIKKYFNISEEIIFYRKYGLGKIFKSECKNFPVATRVIEFERLSRYDLEGISDDINQLL